MIIKINQTASNIKQQFDIDSDSFTALGEIGSYSKYQKITLTNHHTNILGKFKFSKPVNYIPFRYLFKKPNRIQKFLLFKDGEALGDIVKSVDGFFKTRYIITLNDGNTFYCYSISNGRFNNISAYLLYFRRI